MGTVVQHAGKVTALTWGQEEPWGREHAEDALVPPPRRTSSPGSRPPCACRTGPLLVAVFLV